jgi:hypothetical protein
MTFSSRAASIVKLGMVGCHKYFVKCYIALLCFMSLFTVVQKYKHSDDIFKVLFLNKWKPSATRLVPVHSTAKEDVT